MSRTFWRGIGSAALTIASLVPWSTSARAAGPIDVVGNMSAAQFAALIAPQSYKDWGNEPFVAINPTDPTKIVVSGFAYGSNSTGNGASLWYSTNAGSNWTMTFPMQTPVNGVSIPEDQTFAYDIAGVLHGAVLGGSASGTNIYHGTIANPATSVSTTWTAGTVNQFGTNGADQPFMSLSGANVYVGYDDFSHFSTSGVTERVSHSTNNGATFLAANDLPISNGGFFSRNNPGTRVATDSNGNAYAIFSVGTGVAPGVGNTVVSYQLNTFTGGAAWNHTGDTALGGVFIDSGNSHQIDSSAGHPGWFGGVNELRGSVTAIASDRMGQNVYVVYGKQDAGGIDRLYIRDYNPASNTFTSAPVLFSVAGQRAALPSVTVTADGNVWVLYDSYVGPNGDPLALGGTFQAHKAELTSNLTLVMDELLYSWTAPAAQNDPNYGGNRELGDYQYLTSIGNTVYGTFAARGDVNAGAINTTSMIVPFYFSETLAPVPEPATLAMGLQFGLIGMGWVAWRRRRRTREIAAA